MKTTLFAVAVVIILAGVVDTARAGSALDHVRSVQLVACATVQVEEDYTKDDTHGSLDDLAVDLCRALAAAVLGDATKIKVTGYPDVDHALTALRLGSVDLAFGASPSASRAEHYGVVFAPPAFFDGQGFLVERESGITRFADLAEKQVCYIAGTENERRLLLAETVRGVALRHHPFEEVGEMEAALVTGHCAAMTDDVTRLAEARGAFHARSQDFVILPELIALDPMTPAYRQDDPRFGAVVGWTLAALIEAEELGLAKATIADAPQTDDPVQRQLLGKAPGVGHVLGLSDDWARLAILAVGNYGEMFERDLGAHAPYRLERGPNRLWRDGGLIWAPPFQ